VLFKPAGVPASQVAEIVLKIDELEAIRLADLEGMYQERAAEQMNVSRQTFGRIVSSARNKVAQALVQGSSLRIEGGEIEMAEQRTFVCFECGHDWKLSFGTGRPAECPKCHSTSIRRAEKQSLAGAVRGASKGAGSAKGRGMGASQGSRRGRGKGRGDRGGRGRNR
jgi:predicted DNA-binding protein (UPF0251 family)